jgi:hypothetical protein
MGIIKSKIRFEPNYLCYYMLYMWSTHRDSIDKETGLPSVVKFLMAVEHEALRLMILFILYGRFAI